MPAHQLLIPAPNGGNPEPVSQTLFKHGVKCTAMSSAVEQKMNMRVIVTAYHCEYHCTSPPPPLPSQLRPPRSVVLAPPLPLPLHAMKATSGHHDRLKQSLATTELHCKLYRLGAACLPQNVCCTITVFMDIYTHAYIQTLAYIHIEPQTHVLVALSRTSMCTHRHTSFQILSRQGAVLPKWIQPAHIL